MLIVESFNCEYKKSAKKKSYVLENLSPSSQYDQKHVSVCGSIAVYYGQRTYKNSLIRRYLVQFFFIT